MSITAVSHSHETTPLLSLLQESADLDLSSSAITSREVMALGADWNRSGYIGCLYELQSATGISIDSQDDQGQTLLHKALLGNSWEYEARLLELKANPNLPDHSGKSAWQLAIAKKDENMGLGFWAHRFIQNGAPLDIPSRDDPSRTIGSACLREALSDFESRPDRQPLACAVMKLLLEKKADPRVCHADGESLLSKAVTKGERSLVASLLHHQADPNQAVPDASLLHRAVRKGYRFTAELLLQHGANPYVLENGNQTPLGVVYDAREQMLYETLVQKDNGFTNHLHELKLLGQRFDLEEPFYLGSHPNHTYETFAQSIEQSPSQWSPVPWKKSRDVLRAAVNPYLTSSDRLKLWQKKEVVVFPFKLVDHVLPCLFFDKILATANSGFGSGSRPGIHFYKITHLDRVPEVIEKLLILTADRSLDKVEQLKEFENILKSLELKEVAYLHQKLHAVANCAFIAAKLAFLGTIILLHLDERSSLQKLCDVYRLPAEPLPPIRLVYELVILRDKELSLYKLLSLAEQDPRLEPFIPFPTLSSRFTAILEQRSNKYFYTIKPTQEEQKRLSSIRQMLEKRVPVEIPSPPKNNDACIIC